MIMLRILLTRLVFVVCACIAGTTSAFDHPVTLEGQGSFFAGGTVTKTAGVYDSARPTDPAGQEIHGDHAYVFWQRPLHARPYPLVFLHGGGQSGKTFETTPDGRDGFQNLFLEKRYAVYIVDQPRRGRAGKSGLPYAVKPWADEAFLFEAFRLGQYPHVYPESQFSEGDEALAQFNRQMTPNTGKYDKSVISDAMAAVFAKTGPAVLITHSQGGGPGWYTAIKSDNVKGIAAYEPGLFLFPEGEAPAIDRGASLFTPFKVETVPLSEFRKLTRIPIVIYYGDHISMDPKDGWAGKQWAVRLQAARDFARLINRYGGQAKVVHLPEIGIYGNTHFLFADKNNKKIAALLEQWLHEHHLDR